MTRPTIRTSFSTTNCSSLAGEQQTNKSIPSSSGNNTPTTCIFQQERGRSASVVDFMRENHLWEIMHPEVSNIDQQNKREQSRIMWQRMVRMQLDLNRYVVLFDYILLSLYSLYYTTTWQTIGMLIFTFAGFFVNHDLVSMVQPVFPASRRSTLDTLKVRCFGSWLPTLRFTSGRSERVRSILNMIIFTVRFYLLEQHKGLLIPLLIITIAGSPKARNSYWPIIPASYISLNYAIYIIWKVGNTWAMTGSIRECCEILFEYCPYFASILIVTLYMVSVSFFLTLECEKLATTSRQLKNAIKDDFVSHISHEFRCPVLSSLGSIELLKETSLTDVQKDHIETIQTANNIVLSLIEDILHFLKLEHEKIDEGELRKNTHKQIEDFSLESCINMVHNIIKSYSSQLHVNMKVVTSGINNLFVRGNQTRLYQCLTNLLTNAVKASKFSGTVELHCNVLPKSDPKDRIWVEFKVIDHGIGIEEEKQGLLFQPFVQLHETNESIYPGTGLGLVTVKNNIKVMEGTLDMQSKVGVGTTFTMTVPFVKVANKNLPSTPINDQYNKHVTVQKQYMEKYMKAVNEYQKQKQASPNVNPNCESPDSPLLLTSQPSIILAEDNAINRMVLLKLLKSIGYHADAVCDGRELVKKVNPLHHRLVITDFNMPNMDGLQAAEEIRKLHGDSVKIILLTADALKDRNNYRELVDSVLFKPCSKQELKSHIEYYLQ